MSQYKDQITGRVLSNIRIIDNNIVDLIDPIKLTYAEDRGTRPTSDVTLFGDKVMVYGKGYGISSYGNTKNQKLSDKGTINMWVYIPQDIISQLLYLALYTSSVSTEYKNGVVYYLYPYPIVPNNNRKLFIGIAKYNGNNRDEQTLYSTNTSSIILNQWIHTAITYTKNYVRMFVNGSKVLEQTSPRYNVENYYYWYGMRPILQDTDNYKIYYTDAVFIDGQVLWDSNFTVPNDYLLGRDYRPPVRRISKKNIMYPIPIDRNDYFDKAFLY